MVFPMGYCPGNLCLYRSGAPMFHIQHGSFLKRAVLMSLKPQMKGTPATALPHTFSVSLHWNSWTVLPLTESNTSQALLTHMFMGMHATRRVLARQSGFSAWRVFSSISNGNEMLIQAEQSVLERFSSSRKSSQAKAYVVVVESPTKAKTIEKYLGPDYVVLPTYGHVRDLAARVGSVRPDEDYGMIWEVPEAAHTHISKIKQALKGAKCLILASDPDREGEAIAWHVSELLKDEGILNAMNPKVVRVTFNEITKGSVLRALQSPRDICSTLVTAYLARRALDHLIGFALSPVLWRKLPGSRSAGRVQSVALKLVCEREKEIDEFVQQEFWTVEAYAKREQELGEHSFFPVRPTCIDGRKIEKFSFGSDDAKSLSERLTNQPLKVSSVQTRSRRRSPPQPYITSTLQMDAQAKLGYGAVRTMTLAQKLYEGVKLENEQLTGLITYMRTDGLQLSSEAVKDIRALASQRYGDKYVPTESRKFKTKVKNAQEAHEAIRPTDIYRLPSQLVYVLEKDALLLYTLIWKRTVACQMEQAVYEEALVNFVTEDESIYLQAVSSFRSFPGFLDAMEDNHGIITTTADVVAGEQDQGDIEVGKDASIFSLQKSDVVVVKRAEAQQHFTRPPARFSEGLLVKAMEELGIGRPSTYATMLRTLESRNYVRIEHHRIIPETRGRMVTTFLSTYFSKYIDYDFTARLEEQLDEVSGGQVEWKEVLRGFWPEFKSIVDSSIKISPQEVTEMLQGTLALYCFKGLGISGQTCPSCGQGKLMLKLSRFGSGYFFGCNKYPECSYKGHLLTGADTTSSLGEAKDDFAALKLIQKHDVLLGLDPDTNLEVRVKKGPFGYYIQLGQESKERRNFKIPEGVNPNDLTLEKARELMKFPLTLGKHPEDGQPVTLGRGKATYYVRHGRLLASVPKHWQVKEPHEVTLEKAVDLLKGKKVLHLRRKVKAVVAAEDKNRSPQQRETGGNAVVSRARQVTKSISVGAKDGGEFQGKCAGRQRTVKSRAETTDQDVMQPRVDNIKGELKTHRLQHRKISQPIAADGKMEETPVKKVPSSEVIEKADVRSLIMENGSDENEKPKRGRKKAQISVENVEGPKAKTRKQKVVNSEEGERTTQNMRKSRTGSVKETEPKVKRVRRSKKSDSDASSCVGANEVLGDEAGVSVNVGS